ncbi:hypothetical protein QYE76_024339 [Lolium multiflorum]|uniref:Uncharacterized protein n=1 Tax=Lolium multiflorum TaxID=4521 RepID=A0AAD8REM9_LOLMU|nr:hypothetical protein QYE76_024339 [Lolium multiflorum]
MKDIDVILGMNWLEANGALIDCVNKTVSLKSPDGSRMIYQGDKHTQIEVELQLNSMKEVKLEDIPVVNEFQDVFPKELPGKANVVADALSRKSTGGVEQELSPELRKEISQAQIQLWEKEAHEGLSALQVADELNVNLKNEIMMGQLDDPFIMEEMRRIDEGRPSEFHRGESGSLWFQKRICVPDIAEIKEKVFKDPDEPVSHEELELQPDLTYIEKPAKILEENWKQLRNRAIKYWNLSDYDSDDDDDDVEDEDNEGPAGRYDGDDELAGSRADSDDGDDQGDGGRRKGPLE